MLRRRWQKGFCSSPLPIIENAQTHINLGRWHSDWPAVNERSLTWCLWYDDWRHRNRSNCIAMHRNTLHNTIHSCFLSLRKTRQQQSDTLLKGGMNDITFDWKTTKWIANLQKRKIDPVRTGHAYLYLYSIKIDLDTSLQKLNLNWPRVNFSTQ
jgi:hypothetical protein